MAKPRSEASNHDSPQARFDYTEHGCHISLVEPRLSYYHSFVDGPLTRRARQPAQALLRACNDRRRSIRAVLDCTAGWGGDSLTLATHGQRVTMLERHPQIGAVLMHARACLEPAAAAGRLDLVVTDAFSFLEALDEQHGFDCIFLDPMFPGRKSGAKPSKDMQILQALTSNVEIESCFELALQRAHKRVVVKRPARAASLTGRKPDHVYREKTVRFDVYLAANP